MSDETWRAGVRLAPGGARRRGRDDVVATLVSVLGPFIGDAMVRASANGHWDKLGLGLATDEPGCRALLSALGPGLNVFVGRRKGEALVAQVEVALFTKPENP